MTLPPELKNALDEVTFHDGFIRCVTREAADKVVNSFLETARKELKEMLMDTSYHQLHIRGKSRPDLMKREAAVRFVAAVFGGKRK